MGACLSEISRRRCAARASSSRSTTEGAERGVVNNSNTNYISGSGIINNHNPVTNNSYARSPTPPALVSDVSVSATMPPKPTVFHGRDEFVNGAVQMLVANVTTQLAILGSGGMGKTTVALALLHHPQMASWCRDGRLFLSCEALVDADAVVVSLAKLLGLPASGDLLTAVISHLTIMPRVVLVLDNLESVWLTGGAPAPAVEELLGRLAQIPSVSLIITCRGTELPLAVEWTNACNAALEPFSLEAALQTFEQRAGRPLAEKEEDMAKQLLNAVDRMPLAVSLLGQLARRGNSVSELLDRWNREHTMLLRTHKGGRINNVQISIEISIKMLREADDSGEALQLLSLCCMLPDGLRPQVFEQLQPLFEHIERARDDLFAYALVNLGCDKVLKTLSPIRHLVLKCLPAEQRLHNALCSIYFEIAKRLPAEVDKEYKDLAADAAPEMDNLSSLLLTLLSQPSQQVVDAVISFTRFTYLQLPTTTLVSALLPHVECHLEWKARCLQHMGNCQVRLDNYRAGIESLTTASRLFTELGDRSEAAWCKRKAAQPHRLLDEYDHAERLLNEARVVYVELSDDYNGEMCRMELGELMRMTDNYATAIEHLSSARETFNSLQKAIEAAKCSRSLGLVYLEQDNLDSAAAELEAARTAFSRLGISYDVAQCNGILSVILRQKREFDLAETLLREAEVFFRRIEDLFGLAECAYKFGELRRDQERREEAIASFESALGLYEELQMRNDAECCCEQILELKSPVLPSSGNSE